MRTSRSSARACAARPSPRPATRPSTSTASAAPSTASSSTAWTTTPTAPATRASRISSCRCRPTRSSSSRCRPTTSAPSSAAPGGAVINASMRSGTNAFRGTLWEFHRNDALNAVGFFKPTTGVKPKLVRNQFGFVFGGPIVRNRTFFFADYEGFRQISKTLMFASIPTLEQRQGILGRPIQNPLTGEVYANGVIPSSAITSFAKQVLADLPTPTLPGVANNFDSLPAPRGFQQQVRREVRSPVQHPDDRVRARQPPQGGQLRAVADPRRHRQPEQRVRARAQPAGRRRRHLHADAELAARNPPGRVAHRSRKGASRRRRADDAGRVRHHGPADRSRASRAG